MCHTHIGSSRLLSLSLSSSYHPWWAFLSELLDFSFYLSPHFLVFFLSFLSMYSDNFDSVTNNLRNSANGTFVTSDDTFPLTGYEPNDMELNDTVPSKFTDFQAHLVHFTPSSDHDMDDETLGKLLAEVHRDYADYRRPEGVSVSPSSMPVMVDRTGKPVEGITGIAEGRESSSAQIRTLIDQNEIKIWDASLDRQPKIQSSSVEETIQRIMEQTNNDCRFQIFILTSSLRQQPLLAGR